MAPAEFRLRQARARDLDELLALETRVFTSDRMSRRSLRRFLASSGARLIVAESGGKLLGYVLTLFRTGSLTARIYSLAVAPEASGRGIGRRLLSAAETHARRIGRTTMRLEVAVLNRRARAIYLAAGYIETACLPYYYADGGAALRLQKILTKTARQP